MLNDRNSLNQFSFRNLLITRDYITSSSPVLPYRNRTENTLISYGIQTKF